MLSGSLPVGPQKTGPATWRFTVWAPHCKRLALLLDATGVTVPMAPLPGGYYTAEASGLADGARYWFVLDGETRRADPASRFQPDDVHGPAALVDADAFAWTDAAFVPPAPDRRVYDEIHVATFTPQGTFDAVIERLPHLRALGVTCLELMPVAQFPGGRNWGYDGVFPFAASSAYGGPAGLARLVDACHGAGLAVVLDVVYNHLGPEGNYLRDFGPYFTDRYRTPWGEAVNYDGPGSTAVREFFIQNALAWLRDFHIDGLRLDATHAIFDQGPVHFLAELAGRVAEEIIFDTITTGAGNDIERATGMARKMVCEWGMSDVVGPMTIGEQGEEVFIGRDWGHARNYSEDTARIVDAEIKKLVETARENCHKLLQENINLLHALAKALLDRETITGDDIDLLVKGEPLPPFDADGSAAKQEPAAPAPASADAGGETFKLEAEPSQDGGTGEKTQDETKQQ